LITEPSIGPGSPNSVDFMAVSARIENLASWFAASVLVAAGVIYALKLEDDRPRSNSVRLPFRATPAQEPPTLQQRRATEPGRGRRAHVPQQILLLAPGVPGEALGPRRADESKSAVAHQSRKADEGLRHVLARSVSSRTHARGFGCTL
jgi:hypothetical protein